MTEPPVPAEPLPALQLARDALAEASAALAGTDPGPANPAELDAYTQVLTSLLNRLAELATRLATQTSETTTSPATIGTNQPETAHTVTEHLHAVISKLNEAATHAAAIAAATEQPP